MFGVIYSQNTGRIRSHTDTGWRSGDLDLTLKLGKGEVLEKFEDKQYGTLPELQDLLSQRTGLIPVNDRYAIIDTTITPTNRDSTGNVVGAIIADPLCDDAIVNCQLIAHPQASTGWKWTQTNGFEDIRPVGIKVGT
jgi:hypothetical protein